MLLEQQLNKWGMGVKLGKHAQHIPPLRGPGGVIEAEESFQIALYFFVIPSNTPLKGGIVRETLPNFDTHFVALSAM